MSDITVNPWQKFKRLLPNEGRTYATVEIVNSVTNVTTVRLQNGDVVTVKGSAYQVGDRVLIAGGEIRQKVPDLPFTRIELP